MIREPIMLSAPFFLCSYFINNIDMVSYHRM